VVQRPCWEPVVHVRGMVMSGNMNRRLRVAGTPCHARSSITPLPASPAGSCQAELMSAATVNDKTNALYSAEATKMLHDHSRPDCNSSLQALYLYQQSALTDRSMMMSEIKKVAPESTNVSAVRTTSKRGLKAGNCTQKPWCPDPSAGSVSNCMNSL
jgi:hypothetical protein